MNKAFTANINDQVTARGYLDENNQLIMLEPEGSGGGAFAPVSVTIRPAEEQQTKPPFTIEYVGVLDGVASAEQSNFLTKTLELTSIAKSRFLFGSASGYEIVAVSGAEMVEANDFNITGDAVFTYKRVEDSGESS